MKYRIGLAAVACVAIFVAGFLVAQQTSAAPAIYVGWWKCHPNLTLQVSGSKVRCWQAPETQYADPMNCLVGQAYRQDYAGTRDKCVTGIGPAAVAFDPACSNPRDGRLVVRRGKDRCEYVSKGHSAAPTYKTN